MTGAAGLPHTTRQRPPLSRGRKELLASLAALPVLLAAGVYIGGRISDDRGRPPEPAAGVASPLATTLASPTRTAPTRAPVTASPTRAPVATRPTRPAPAPTRTIPPPAPRPVATKPPAPPAPPPTAPPLAAPPGPARLLGPGSTGAEVRAWQQQMARRTWRIRVDGVFGPQSERVARAFQRRRGLRVDGLVGPQTWAAAWRLPIH